MHSGLLFLNEEGKKDEDGDSYNGDDGYDDDYDDGL